MNILSFLISFCFVFISVLTHAEVKTGAQAPSFSLKGDDGKSHGLEKGKYVILEWYNNECPYVKKYYNSHRMQELQQKFTKRADVVWYSVISSKEGKQGHAGQKEAQGLRKKRASHQTAILLDEKGKVGQLYGAKTTPHIFIIDPKGQVIYQGAIDDQPSANKKTLVGAKNYIEMAFADIDAKRAIQVSDTKPYGCSVKY